MNHPARTVGQSTERRGDLPDAGDQPPKGRPGYVTFVTNVSETYNAARDR